MTTTQKQLHLAYAADEKYARYVEVAIRAAYCKASRPADLIIHFLDCGLSDETWEGVQSRVKATVPAATLIRHVIAMARFQGFKTWWGSQAIYARLFLPTLLPDVEWCLYADADTLFLEDPLMLCDCFDPSLLLQGYPDPSCACEPRVQEWFRKVGCVAVHGQYLCSGFLIFNLKKWREEGIEAKSLKLLDENPGAAYPDQDALNAACSDRLGVLPEGWGTFTSRMFAVDRPKCVHYFARESPWRAEFSWRTGYRDNLLIWLNCARVLVGIQRREIVKVPAWKWCLGRLYARLVTMAVLTLSKVPKLGNRLRYFHGRFCDRKHRYLLSPKFWEQPSGN